MGEERVCMGEAPFGESGGTFKESGLGNERGDRGTSNRGGLQ